MSSWFRKHDKRWGEERDVNCSENKKALVAFVALAALKRNFIFETIDFYVNNLVDYLDLLKTAHGTIGLEKNCFHSRASLNSDRRIFHHLFQFHNFRKVLVFSNLFFRLEKEVKRFLMLFNVPSLSSTTSSSFAMKTRNFLEKKYLKIDAEKDSMEIKKKNILRLMPERIQSKSPRKQILFNWECLSGVQYFVGGFSFVDLSTSFIEQSSIRIKSFAKCLKQSFRKRYWKSNSQIKCQKRLNILPF